MMMMIMKKRKREPTRTIWFKEIKLYKYPVVTYVKKISEKKVISDPTLKEFGGIQSDKKED